MKILIDMNLSPDWVPVLENEGFETVHWSKVGSPSAQDSVIIQYAREHGFVIFTHDLDFGAILALTKTDGPSVVQLRAQNILPDYSAGLLISTIKHNREHLEQGALIVIDEARARVRILPL